VRPIRQIRPEIPSELAATLNRLLAKIPDDRFALPGEVAAALQPFTVGCDLPRLLREAGKEPSNDREGTETRVAPDRVAVTVGTTRATAKRRWHRFQIALVGMALACAVALALGVTARWVDSFSAPGTLEEMKLLVRRDGDDQHVFYLDLLDRQAQDAIDPPLRPQDDFKLVGRWKRPTYWYVAWIDSAGQVKIVAHSDGRQAKVQYPTRDGYFASVNPEDPAGIHLLVLIAGAVPPGTGEDQLARALQGIGKPPLVPKRWAAQLRGPGGERAVLPSTPPGNYLKELEDRLPKGLEAAHVVFLRTVKD
jgi:hypothetical protein